MIVPLWAIRCGTLPRPRLALPVLFCFVLFCLVLFPGMGFLVRGRARQSKPYASTAEKPPPWQIAMILSSKQETICDAHDVGEGNIRPHFPCHAHLQNRSRHQTSLVDPKHPACTTLLSKGHEWHMQGKCCRRALAFACITPVEQLASKNWTVWIHQRSGALGSADQPGCCNHTAFCRRLMPFSGLMLHVPHRHFRSSCRQTQLWPDRKSVV